MDVKKSEEKQVEKTRILGYVVAKECTPEEIQLVGGGLSFSWTDQGEWKVQDD